MAYEDPLAIVPITPAVAAGWYDDGTGHERWWNGDRWADHMPAGWYNDSRGRRRWWDGTELVTKPDGEFFGLLVHKGLIAYGGQTQPVAGVQVVVETAGELYARSSVGRTAVGGVLFGPAGLIVGAMFKKKQDLRELYMLVDGPEYAWAIAVSPRLGMQARQFAAWTMSMSKHYTLYPLA